MNHNCHGEFFTANETRHYRCFADGSVIPCTACNGDQCPNCGRIIVAVKAGAETAPAVHASDIGPSWSKVLPEVELWACKMAELARSKMAGKIIASVWPYRIHRTEYLSVDMTGQDGGDMNITIATGADRTDYSFEDLETTCFDVPDMTEALTMVSRFLHAVDATISLAAR